MGITNNQGSTDNVVIIEDDSSRPAVADVIPPSNDSKCGNGSKPQLRITANNSQVRCYLGLDCKLI